MLGTGRPRCHLGHVDDVVSGLLLCAAHQPSRGECFILGGAEHPTVAELIAEIAAACGVPGRALHVPAMPVAAAARLVAAWRDPARSLSGFFDRADFFLAERTYTIDRARRVLGFAPRVTLREGIRETVEWYRAVRLL
jgi:nucleoside-diphosphate-sugar epimerase